MPKPQPVTYDEIDDACEGKSSLINNPPFLRHNMVKRFVRKDRIKATLKTEGVELPENISIDMLVKYVLEKAQQVFLTLILSQTLRHICSLYNSDFADEHLPVSKSQDRKRRIISQRSSEKADEAFEDWTSPEKDRFVEKQWAFLALILKGKEFEYDVEEEQPLPLLSVTDPQSAEGHFGAVTKAQIPSEHRQDPQPDARDPCLVAVKHLAMEGVEEAISEKFYKREVQTLRKMRHLSSPHLIKAYAAIKKRRGRRCDRVFIFPWASEGNLSSFWAKHDAASNKIAALGWALSQICGLADGIKQLHERKTRHGDIKPENILVFHTKGRTTLVIADVGLAKSHALYTGQRLDPTTTIHGSRMYEPPEARENNQILSRKYDVWSFGCVLFQFLIWLVNGPGGIRDFLTEFKTDGDYFWKADRESVTVRPVIEKWAENLSRSIQQRKVPSKFQGTLKGLLNLIQKRLLIVDVNSAAGSRVAPRADAAEMLSKINKICDKSLFTYRFPLDPQSGRLSQGSGSEVAAQDVTTPLSRNGTRQLRDTWENVTDNGVARRIISGLRQIFPVLLETQNPPICDGCKTLNFSSNILHLSRSLATGKGNSKGCALCKLIDQVISRAGMVYGKNLRLFRTQSTLSTSPAGPPLLSIYSDPGSTVDTSSYAQIGLPWLPEAASSQEFHILREWIRLCDETHACFRAQDDGNRVSRLPTRVIDVGQADDPLLRLAQPSTGIRDKYVALSHCWGKINRDSDSRLENGNIKEFMKAISFNKLPKMFRDAIEVTRALSIRYLWIDSLCIIQDSDHDWEVESRKMEDVYSLAYVTIAASSAESSLKGFIHDRQTRACAKVATTDALLYIAEAIDDFQTDVEDGVLNTRAWVLQERALSRRTIHFTSAQIYWECGKGVHCETLAQLRNPVSQFLGDHDFPNLGLQYFKDERIQLIQYLYMRYSELKLSNATDRPAAISGLQKRLGCTFKSEADCGIIWKYFERTIFWKARIEHGLSRIQYKSSQVSPPSWSWMGYSGTISYLEIPFGKVDWTGDLWNPPSTQKPGPYYEMALLASARKIVIRGSILFASVTLDMDIRADFGGGQWRCVTVGKDKTTDALGDTAYYVLLIRPMLAGKSRDIYERVGVGTLHGGGFSTEVEQVWLL